MRKAWSAGLVGFEQSRAYKIIVALSQSTRHRFSLESCQSTLVCACVSKALSPLGFVEFAFTRQSAIVWLYHYNLQHACEMCISISSYPDVLSLSLSLSNPISSLEFRDKKVPSSKPRCLHRQATPLANPNLGQAISSSAQPAKSSLLSPSMNSLLAQT